MCYKKEAHSHSGGRFAAGLPASDAVSFEGRWDGGVPGGAVHGVQGPPPERLGGGEALSGGGYSQAAGH